MAFAVFADMLTILRMGRLILFGMNARVAKIPFLY
jgi:hypothetical protein